jgi:acetyl-CoA carboxylase biotin carboxyl carrier protein
MTPELEQLAALLDSYSLTRLEYEQGDWRVVLERQPAPATQLVSVAPIAAVSGTAAQLGDPTAAVDGTTTATTATAPTAAAAAAAAAAAEAASAQSPSSPTITVTAPLVGIAYRSHEPGAAPFVECGQQVAEGDVVCLIEAMKLFNEITAPAAGIVNEILFEDGALAEYGTPLVTILPAGD